MKPGFGPGLVRRAGRACASPAVRGARARAAADQPRRVAARGRVAGAAPAARLGAPAAGSGGAPPLLRTNRTRRVLHPVLIGHAASFTPY